MKPIISKLIVLSALAFSACSKQEEWLDIKANKADVTPTTIENYQALLDASDQVMNSSTPGMGILSADNYYITTATWNAALNDAERNGYLWAADIWQGLVGGDWNTPHAAIGVTNIVLDGLKKITPTPATQSAWNNVRGSALLYRAFHYYQLVQLFAKPYDPATAATDPGLGLRVNSDINAVLPRASVAETYEQMLNDLTEAESLLPEKPLYQTRPSKQAVYALLAKIYLHMEDFDRSSANAAKALQIAGTLIDFNTLSTTATKPMPVFPANTEVILYTVASLYSINSPTSNRCIVDTILVQSYAANDLRKTFFFTAPNATGQVFFKGQYTATNNSFSGLAINEMLLIQAEALARKQQVPDALTALNKLLIKRWKTGTFQPVTAANAQDALKKILDERRKELPFTGSGRWEDLRRLNRDPVFARTLTRTINNQPYQLLPNDKRYVLPIPDAEIRLSGIAQNPR